VKEAADLLQEGLAELGIPCRESQRTAFLLYLAELKKWNRAYGLTSLRTERDIVIRHFLDSLLFLRMLPGHVRTLADIGSGAGFPGLPIKIMRPDIMVFLVEPTQKKVHFLRHLCHMLGLQDVEIIGERVEDIKHLKVDAAVTRALFSVRDFARKAKGIVSENGVLILSKGPGIEEELRGMTREHMTIEDFSLPFERAVRHLVRIERVGKSHGREVI
jgi:16S rRNA (guanine527-N7)-methyltransferase